MPSAASESVCSFSGTTVQAFAETFQLCRLCKSFDGWEDFPLLESDVGGKSGSEGRDAVWLVAQVGLKPFDLPMLPPQSLSQIRRDVVQDW